MDHKCLFHGENCWLDRADAKESNCGAALRTALEKWVWNDQRKDLLKRFMDTEIMRVVCEDFINTEIIFGHGSYFHPDVDRPRDIDLIVVTKGEPRGKDPDVNYEQWMTEARKGIWAGVRSGDITMLSSLETDYITEFEELAQESIRKYGRNLITELWRAHGGRDPARLCAWRKCKRQGEWYFRGQYYCEKHHGQLERQVKFREVSGKVQCLFHGEDCWLGRTIIGSTGEHYWRALLSQIEPGSTIKIDVLVSPNFLQKEKIRICFNGEERVFGYTDWRYESIVSAFEEKGREVKARIIHGEAS